LSSFSSTFNADSSSLSFASRKYSNQSKDKKEQRQKRGIKTTKTLFFKKEILIENAHNTHTHAYLKRQQQGKPFTLLSRGIIK